MSVTGRLLPADEVVEVRPEGVTTRYDPACNRALRVLVADDNTDAADSLAMLVKMWGHDARLAYDGAAVLGMTFAYQPDVLLLDVAMPQMDGFRLARVIGQQARCNGALLVAISGYADGAHRLLGKEAGFDHYRVKPAEPTTVEQLLRLAKEQLADPPQGPHATPGTFALVAHREAASAAKPLRWSMENAGATGTGLPRHNVSPSTCVGG